MQDLSHRPAVSAHSHTVEHDQRGRQDLLVACIFCCGSRSIPVLIRPSFRCCYAECEVTNVPRKSYLPGFLPWTPFRIGRSRWSSSRPLFLDITSHLDTTSVQLGPKDVPFPMVLCPLRILQGQHPFDEHATRPHSIIDRFVNQYQSLFGNASKWWQRCCFHPHCRHYQFQDSGLHFQQTAYV